jgi:hypothetical protein
MIKDQLQKLGLGEKEVTLYLAVLQNGKLPIHQASRLTGINRTTLYGVAQELASKGLIINDLGAKPNTLVAVPPEELRSLVERKKNIIDNLIPELHTISKDTGFSVPKIKFIPELDLESYLYSEADRWDKSMMEVDSTLWSVQDPTFGPKYQEWIKWYYTRPHTDTFRSIVITNGIEKDMPQFRQRKAMILDEKLDFNSAVWVRGHYIVMVSYKEKPNYLIEIYDKRLAHNLRELIKGVWEKNHIAQ